ncbi:branched-chain amino acid ABC transporter permease [Zeimonas arvi]|uniref:Branched-chain amino acid ABC transporter permease n=1 Tax=Zeimonas arvi TaxID=2498847 RepID=A0A5C8NT21_9BURK|nr:branched-chain amino acid ABC transporter permease [Zeimonas arvi]TXL64570.1 branched-chain amino acid ABC transporter permease [Zeimonas arvi]
MAVDEAPSAPRAAERRAADRIYYTLAALIGGVVSVYFVLVPVFELNLAFHFYLMLWITMASAFNVAAGFSGYMPFGYVAFYGVGAFTTAILVKTLGFPVLLALPFSGAAGIALGLLFAPTLRLSGIYFAIVSLALASICRLVITNMPEHITGGSFGLQLGSRAEPVLSFYVMLAVMLVALATFLWLARSRLGKALRAVRDDAEAADMMGVNVARVRLHGWLIAAFFPALCGGVEAWYTNVVDTETAFNTLITAKTVIYAVAGGLGTITGPVIGSIVMVWLDELIWRQFPLLNLLILGVATVLLVLFLPRGIVGTLLRRRPQWRRYIP